METVFTKFIKFGVVGGSGLVIDFSATWLLKEKLGTHKLVANSVGFILAATSNYYLNRIWTFESTNEDLTTEFSLFLFFAVIGLLINNTILYLLNEKLKVPFYFAKLLAIGVTVIWNFGSNFLFNFQ